MKKSFIILSVLSILSFCAFQIQQYAQAVVIGKEPPSIFINNLKNCTKSSLTDKGSTIDEYIIKGTLPNGRCEVIISSYTNFADNKVYANYKTMAKSIGKMAKANIQDSDIPTQQQMIEQGKKEKDITICKLSQDERNALYNAYQKHDSKNPPAKMDDKGNMSFSFDSSKISSYDKLMLLYSNGPCTTPENEHKEKRYVCEYADTTCYYSKQDNGISSMKCTKEPPQDSFKFMDTVQKHVESGMCQLI